MERSFLTEAFRSLQVLNEEDFNMSDTEDVEAMDDFANDSDEEEFINVIDPTAETEEDLDDSYVGKVICDCMTCHSKIYKLPTDIIIDEESGLANVGEECPYCFDSTGFKIIGEVADYNPDKGVEDDLGMDGEAEEKPAEEPIEEVPAEGEEAPIEEPALPKEDEEEEEDERKNESLTEEVHEVEVKTDDQKVEVKEENGELKVEIKKCDEELGDEGLAMSDADVAAVNEPFEGPGEFEPGEPEGEEIVPISPETQDLIDSSSNELQNEGEAQIVDDELQPLPGEEDVNYDLEDFDEESFDGLGESYLKRVYENVDSFKTTEVRQKDDKLMLEGVIKFNSGKQKKTSFIFEASEATPNGKVKFLGENAQISRGKKSFALRGNISGNKFISESFTYNYMTKDADDKSVRLYGTIKRNK